MLNIFGIGVSVMPVSYHLKNTVCPSCGGHNTFRTRAELRYFHVFGISFLPLGKKIWAQCGQCRSLYARPDFSAGMEQALERSMKKLPLRQPVWYSLGFLLLLTLLLAAMAVFTLVWFL